MGLVCGTPAYMSPEQLGGDPVPPMPATDVYALGVTLHELLSGRARVGVGEVGDHELAQIIATATAARAVDRHPSVDALGEALRQRLAAIEADQGTLRRTRRSLTAKVQAFWIAGVLRHSVHSALMIELGLALRPEAIEHPWDLVVQAPGRVPCAVPQGKPIAEVFDESGHALLILGAPGAGKTTLLLDLAAALLERAREDDTQPVPVVFHLSTWADRRLPFDDWLVDELDKRYDIPPGAGRICLGGRELVLLLDGLDEVAPAHRADCVDAVNAYCKAHGEIRLAVCSRLADCEALPVRLRLGQASRHPVAHARPDRRLSRACRPVPGRRARRAASRRGAARAADTPLLLSIAALAYQEGAAMQSAGTPAQRRAQLFAAYAEAMFNRRSPATRYPPERATRWLGWLANAMLAHHQSVFYLEWMQPCWLPRPLERWAAGGGSIVLCGLLTGLILGLGGHFAGDFAFSMPVSLLFGLVGGLAFAFSGWGDQIRPVTRLGWSLSRCAKGPGPSSHAASVSGCCWVSASRWSSMARRAWRSA